MTRTDEYYFTKAKNVSTCSDFHKTHIGCIAVYQGHVIAVGYNTNKTHPIQQHYNKYREEKLAVASLCSILSYTFPMGN